jgi:multidrug efflux pump subunit AcrA (membrane-fusion protein)
MNPSCGCATAAGRFVKYCTKWVVCVYNLPTVDEDVMSALAPVSNQPAPARTSAPSRALRRAGQGAVRWIVTSAIVGLALAVAAIMTLRIVRPQVIVTEAVEGPVVAAFYSTGTIQPQREYPIKSNTAGLLKEVRVDKGDRVKKGDVLAIVEDPALVFAEQEAQAMLEEKLQRIDPKASPVLQEYDSKIAAMNDLLDIAKREQKRVTDLLSGNAGAQTDLDQAMDRVKRLWSESESLKAQRAAKLLEMQREVEVARAALGVAKWNLEQQTLVAPLDGVVLDRPIAVRTRVAINDAIMRIADVRPANLIMRAAVDEEDVTKVNVGQTVRMTLYSFTGQVLSGTVEKIYDQADADRRTFEVDVKLDHPSDRLAPGMTGELAFVIAEKPVATVVPAQAVQNGTIWLVRNGRLTRSTAQVGIKSIERVEVLTGVTKGDVVVISSVGNLQDGQSVRTQKTDPRVAAGLNKPPPIEQAFKAFSK